jgi:hypothetical protein
VGGSPSSDGVKHSERISSVFLQPFSDLRVSAQRSIGRTWGCGRR